MPIVVEDMTLKGLIAAARAADARRVLLTDYSSVKTKRTKDGFVLVGMLMNPFWLFLLPGETISIIATTW